MTSGADLFVVCKQCGSEVSPYVTECPYCGHRLRRRAPKLPRDRLREPRKGPLRGAPLGRLAGGGSAGVRVDTQPYATIALVAASCGVWIASQGSYVNLGKLVILGPLNGDWWRLLSSQFVYGSGFSAGMCMFATLLCVAVFGGLIARRQGALV